MLLVGIHIYRFLVIHLARRSRAGVAATTTTTSTSSPSHHNHHQTKRQISRLPRASCSQAPGTQFSQRARLAMCFKRALGLD